MTSMTNPTDRPAYATPAVTFEAALPVWLRIGLLSFGGPAGQIALMHRMLVDERKWLDEATYLAALNFCMLLPGPEAMQLATYAGWRMHGLRGGLAAGLLFVMPGALVILALSMIYGAWGNVPVMQATFVGIKAAVLAIVVEALLRIARRALKRQSDWVIAGLAFVAIFFLTVPFPLVVAAAALAGYVRGPGTAAATTPASTSAAPDASLSDTLRTVLVWLAIWIVPLAAVSLAYPQLPVFRDLAWFFSKMAVVTFGGAYAVLAYVAQEGVSTYGWLKPGEMVDGLGLAETTPGPLILVNAFVGYLGALRWLDGGQSVVNGIIGWAIVLWATFAPCFLWIFAGAPYIERINRNPRLKSALSAVSAAVVGVVLNLTVWFSLNVVFGTVRQVQAGPLHLHVPELATISWTAAALAILAGVLLFALHRGIVTVLAVCGAASLVLGTLPRLG